MTMNRSLTARMSLDPSPTSRQKGRKSIGLMTKYWAPGQVKTRLARSIGFDRAAKVQREFFRQLTDQIASEFRKLHESTHLSTAIPSLSDLHFEIVHWPADSGSKMLVELGPQADCWRARPQLDGSLGDRMSGWFSQVLPSTCPQSQLAGRPAAILIGCDCPTLSASLLLDGLQQLETADVVIGPATDGGYYLIGFSGPFTPEKQSLFVDIPWSTDEVYALTLDRVNTAQLKLVHLPVMSDVDEREDLDRLIAELTSSSSSTDQAFAHRLVAILADTATSDTTPSRTQPSPSSK